MIVSELIEILKTKRQDAQVWLPAVNKEWIPTYSLCDSVDEYEYEQIVTDVMDNPGTIDDRLLHCKSDKIVYIGSNFF